MNKHNQGFTLTPNFGVGSARAERGFTLIELLVVISVIGLLASMILVSLNSARVKARDARRLADMRQISTSLGLYYDKNGFYPQLNSENDNSGSYCGGWDTSKRDADGDGRFFIPALVTEGFMSKVPGDPFDSQLGQTGCGGYDYYLYSAGSYDCSAAKGGFFVFGIRDMEGISGGNHPSSPGWRCPIRDWSTEFEWVTGGYTK